jgi:hypothetical protein
VKGEEETKLKNKKKRTKWKEGSEDGKQNISGSTNSPTLLVIFNNTLSVAFLTAANNVSSFPWLHHLPSFL